MTLEAILQECALSGYSLHFRGLVLEVEEGAAEPKPVGITIAFNSTELGLRTVNCITQEIAKDRGAFTLSIQKTYRQFKEMIELRSKLLLIVKNAPMGITLPQIQSLAHSYGSYEESSKLITALVELKLVREESGSYFPV